MKKEFVIKSLKETFADKPRHEIHLNGCKHLNKNVLQVTKPLQSISIEQLLVDYVDSENGDRDDYKLAPCTK